MKKIYKYLTFAALTAMILVSCRKEETLNVDINSLNPDNPTTNTPLNQWLTSNFLDTYNIDVIYRYNRYYHSTTANITPPKLTSVQPTMQIVLDGFINPYRKIAGATFTKKFMPKEWILFGSYSYDNLYDHGVAGTASAGRRITLYGLNEYRPMPDGQFYAWDRQRIMHHEFAHILNQIIPIPVDFEPISKGLYKQPFINTPADVARANGFINSYASGSSVEDYAESVTYPLVNGQAWYDAYANGSTAEGKNRLIQKELNVITYFTALGVNYKELQKEVQLYMKNTLNKQEAKFPYWLGQKLWSSMTVNLNSDVYTTYGKSAEFETVYNEARANVNAIPFYGLTFNFIKFNFTSATAMNMEISFNQGSAAHLANYAFNMAINQTTDEIVFTKETTAPWVGNAGLLALPVAPLLNYLTGNTFVGDWLPVSINGDNYMKFGGFSVKGAPTNYFYGPLAY